MLIRYRLRGDNIIELLAESDLTITDAARKSGMARSHLSQLISGKRYASPSVRRRLLACEPFCQLDRAALFERVESTRAAPARNKEAIR